MEIYFAGAGAISIAVGAYFVQLQEMFFALGLGFGLSIYSLSFQEKPDIRSFCLGIFPLLASLLGYQLEALLFLPLLGTNDQLFRNKAWLIGFFTLLFLPVFSLGSELEQHNNYLLLGPILSVLILRYTQSKNDRMYLETLCVLPLLFLTGNIQTEFSLQITFFLLVCVGLLNRQSSFLIVACIIFAQGFIELSQPLKVALLLAGMSGVFGSIVFISALLLFAQGSLYYPIAAAIVAIILTSRAIEERKNSFLDRAWIFSLPILFYSMRSLDLQLSVEVLVCLLIGIALFIAVEFTRHLYAGKIFSTKMPILEIGEGSEVSDLKPEMETNWNNNLAPTSSRFIKYYEIGLGVISTGFVLVWFYFN
ncbi:MAG: hypothetical protein VX642_02870 [Bdellovibrionota bacterium]|nr:hypothetical protein [Bdellovibrionota bacterium]